MVSNNRGLSTVIAQGLIEVIIDLPGGRNMFDNLFSSSREKSDSKKNKKSNPQQALSIKKSTRTRAADAYAPNTKIAFKPELVALLLEEQQTLLSVFEKASMTAYAGLNAKSKVFFTEFKDIFVDHVLRENISVYIYLLHVTDNQKTENKIRKIKSEMDSIAREIMRFLKFCIDESTEFDEDVLVRIDSIGLQLKQRIETTESMVYPNYARASKQRSPRKKRKVS